SAEQLYRQAAEHGNTNALVRLAEMREQAGDPSGAEQLYRQAAEHGNPLAVSLLIPLRERVGDPSGAELIRAFGLTDTGEPAESLD
ncbi:hypothetical protein, partial [Actinoplanes sp. NPDC049681]|uniref:hypothetical protein n=1 Tax=Actinoplanes sp. NPDC049681 TaxID=3363905 RepID=UPI00378786F4